MDLSMGGLWASMGGPARFIVILMLLMLLACLYVAFDRALLLMRARGQSRRVAEAVATPLRTGDIPTALKVVSSPDYSSSYLAAILKGALTELATRFDRHGVAASDRAMERITLLESAKLRKGMNILATTGSTTPFVGLVGTILGIITAFGKMAEAGGGDLSAVSGGIAEALVSTAAGIVVAIVGVWLYNYFNAALDDVSKDMSTSIAELQDWSEKQLLVRNPPLQDVG